MKSQKIINPVCEVTPSAQTNKRVWGYTGSDKASNACEMKKPVDEQGEKSAPYTAFEHYVPGRDI